MSRARAVAAALGLLLASVAAVGAKPAAKPAAPAAKTDWTRTFSVTTEGGFRMGNPKAKIAVVEYGSLTCPHCRHFAQTAVKPLLDQYVRTGKASYEFRPYVLNGIDLAATLVARCNGPAHFFPMAEQLYATQPDWIGRIAKLPDDAQNKLNALPRGEMMVGVAKAAGLLPVAASHGIPPAKAQLCLKDDKAAARLAEIEKAAIDNGVKGTPGFFVNGKQVAAYDWPSLVPFLKEAGG
jgi:protein-disulfide isomerase